MSENVNSIVISLKFWNCDRTI